MTRTAAPIATLREPAGGAPGRARVRDDARAGDPTAFAEATIGGLLGLVALSPQAKRRLGLSGASRRADGWPAWYLWLAGCSGAYELALVPPDAASFDHAGADFTLRYYPHPDEDDFSAFADIERQARVSPLFDHTGTPAIKTLVDIDPSLFHIATLSLCGSRRDGGLDLTLVTQDVWLETTDEHDDGGTRRRVPGLALVAPLVDFLVCGRTYHGRHPPAAFVLARQPGLCWHVDASGGRPAVSADANLFMLRVDGLPSLGVPEALCIAGAATEPPPPEAIVRRHDGDEVPARAEPFATDEWWRAAKWKFYPVGAMCGCQAEEAVVVGHDDAEPNMRRSR